MDDARLEARIGICRERLAAAPGSRAFAPLADLLRQAGRHEEALALLEDGLVRHPGFHGAMVILGRTLLDAGRTAHGLRVLGRVLEHDEENLVALRLLAEEALGRGADSEARPWLQRLTALEPEEPRWAEALGAGPQGSGGSPADQAVSAADSPEDAFATMTLVDIYVAQGYHTRALEALERIRRRDPSSEDVQRRIAEISRAAAESENRDTAADGRAVATPRPAAEMANRRAREKAHFAAWLDQVNREGGRAP